jgi:prepilin-type N-terminal cleavage/methylation domain-containing protein
MTHDASPRPRTGFASTHGFSVLELLVVVGIVAVLAAVAVGVTPGVLNSAKGSSGMQQLESFLKRHREMAISRRRNIEIRFEPPNVVRSLELPVPPDPSAPTLLETMIFEGGIEFVKFDDIPADTPDGFGNADAINLGGGTPVLFTSEGVFVDVNGDPINATLLTGVEDEPLTANALTILGTTATMRVWRHDGGRWVH